MCSVDSHIAKFEPEVSHRIMIMRKIASDIFINSTEKIYHGVITFFTQDGKEIINFGGFKDHISIWIGYDLVNFFKLRYTKLKYTKVTVQISHNSDFPYEFVEEICKIINERLD